MILHVAAFRVVNQTILLAVLLPLIVFCAAHVRQRQLQSTANPRWMEFTATDGPRGDRPRKASESFNPPPDFPNGQMRLMRQDPHSSFTTGSGIEISSIEIPETWDDPATIGPKYVSLTERQSPPMANKPAALIQKFETPQKPHLIKFRTEDEICQSLLDSTHPFEMMLPQTGPEKPDLPCRESQLEDRLSSLQRQLDQLSKSQIQSQRSELDIAIKILRQLEQSEPRPRETGHVPAISDVSETLSEVNQPSKSSLDKMAKSSGFPSGKEGAIHVIPQECLCDSRLYSLEFHNAELTQVLATLARESGANLIFSAEIHGTVSLKLQSVTILAALEAVLKSRGYVLEIEGDFIFVTSKAEVARRKH